MIAQSSSIATPARPRFPPRPALVVVEKRRLPLAAAEHAPQHVREWADGVFSGAARVAAELVACTRAVLSFSTVIDQAIRIAIYSVTKSRAGWGAMAAPPSFLAQEDADRGPIVKEGLYTSGG